jgi:hypothetical protein
VDSVSDGSSAIDAGSRDEGIRRPTTFGRRLDVSVLVLSRAPRSRV